MGPMMRIAALAAALAGFNQPPAFTVKFGNNPRAINGGGRSGVAAAKRAKAKRRNIAKHCRTAHRGARHG